MISIFKALNLKKTISLGSKTYLFSFQMINGKCLFYEQKRFDHSAAQENCGGVLPNGKLFEPADEAENDLVYKELKFMFGASYIRIGINDKSSEGNFTYDSSGKSIFTKDKSSVVPSHEITLQLV